MIDDAPAFDRRKHAPDHRAVAAHAWTALLAQEERSRVFTARLVGDLARLGAPPAVLAMARRIADDEARHVELCTHVVLSLGFEPTITPAEISAPPADDAAFEQAIVELLVAGFAVGETMSVGGFVAARAVTEEPLMRWTLSQLARDEVRHGAFGEEASAWALRGWSTERRRTLWPACVAVMEQVERRGGGPLGSTHAHGVEQSQLAILGAPSARVSAFGLLRAVPRWVLPRLARLGVLPG